MPAREPRRHSKHKTPEQWLAERREKMAKKRRYPKQRGRKYTVIFERDKGICQICKKAVAYLDGTLDHIRPYSHGGEGIPDNLQLSHAECNLLKSNIFDCECELPPGAPGCRKGVEWGWKKYADNLERRQWFIDWKYNGGPKMRPEWDDNDRQGPVG